MSTKNNFGVPYLRVQRRFPQESQQLAVELENSYIDIAQSVNSKVIGIFAEGQDVIDGTSWKIGNNRYQGFQRVYPIASTGSTPHDLTIGNIYTFIDISGSFTDGTNYYPIPYIDVVSATNQVSISITPTDIVITPGAGSPPTFVSGIVVLSWIVRI